jgi:hypothetical protein
MMTAQDGEGDARLESWKVDKQGQRGQDVRPTIIVIGGQLTDTVTLVFCTRFAPSGRDCARRSGTSESMYGGGQRFRGKEDTRDGHAKLHPAPRGRRNAHWRKG